MTFWMSSGVMPHLNLPARSASAFGLGALFLPEDSAAALGFLPLANAGVAIANDRIRISSRMERLPWVGWSIAPGTAPGRLEVPAPQQVVFVDRAIIVQRGHVRALDEAVEIG